MTLSPIPALDAIQEPPPAVADALNAYFDAIGVTTKIPTVLAWDVWNICANADRANHTARADVAERRAPVQGYSAGIPWSMHLRAYDAYVKAHGRQDALIDLEGRNCRGGFATNELDVFIPGWRDELSEVARLKARITELEAASRKLSMSDDKATEGLREALQTILDTPRDATRSYAALYGDVFTEIRAALAPSKIAPSEADDIAVDRFAAAMKAKLAQKRAEGRGGWENKDECSAEFLSELLRGHVDKGDPVDVGNLAMMLHQRGERITPATIAPMVSVKAGGVDETH